MCALSIRDSLRSTIQRFKREGVNEAGNIAEIIFRKILNVSRSDLFLRQNLIFDSDSEIQLDYYIKRIIKGEPVQYVIGETEFYGLKIFCDKSALIPRPETEILVESVLDEIKGNPPSEILDIGTGTGCISIALAKYSGCKVTAVDVNSDTIKLAKKNSLYHQVEDKIEFIQADIFNTDIDLVLNRKYDMVVSNPPYVSSEEMSGLDRLIIDNEPLGALTDFKDGMKFYRKYIEILPVLCRKKAEVFLEIAENRSEIITETLSQLLDNIEIIKDLAGKPRVLKGCFLK